MNPQDPLAQLHPLREPELVGWWPLAPGWWLLAGLLLLGVAVLAWLLIRRYRANAYRRQGLAQLQQLQKTLREGGDTGNYLAGVNALLKSVALRAYPRRDIAGINGARWLEFLNSSAAGAVRFDGALAEAVYRERQPQIDPDSLHRAAATWINKHRRPQ